MMIRMLLSAGAILLLAVGGAQAAGNVAAGKAKSAACAGCHGANGQGSASYPKLAGKSEAVLLKALQDFKSGKVKSTIMHAMAAGLSEQDMENLAAYYASLK